MALLSLAAVYLLWETLKASRKTLNATRKMASDQKLFGVEQVKISQEANSLSRSLSLPHLIVEKYKVLGTTETSEFRKDFGVKEPEGFKVPATSAMITFDLSLNNAGKSPAVIYRTGLRHFDVDEGRVVGSGGGFNKPLEKQFVLKAFESMDLPKSETLVNNVCKGRQIFVTVWVKYETAIVRYNTKIFWFVVNFQDDKGEVAYMDQIDEPEWFCAHKIETILQHARFTPERKLHDIYLQ